MVALGKIGHVRVTAVNDRAEDGRQGNEPQHEHARQGGAVTDEPPQRAPPSALARARPPAGGDHRGIGCHAAYSSLILGSAMAYARSANTFPRSTSPPTMTAKAWMTG